MGIKWLGVLDIATGLSFWIFGIFGVLPEELVLFLGLMIIVKGVVFSMNRNFVSIIDIIFGFIIISSAQINVPAIIVIIISLFLLQKGIFSLLG